MTWRRAGCRWNWRYGPHRASYAAISVGYPAQTLGIALRHAPAKIADPLGVALRRLSIPDLSAQGLPAPKRPFSLFQRTGTMPVLDHGFVAAVRSGAIRIRPGVSRLDGDEVVHDDGSRSSPDAVIAATGYSPGLDAVLGPLRLIDTRGLPTVGSRGGASQAPGLHAVGISSQPLWAVARDRHRCSSTRALDLPLSRLVPTGGHGQPAPRDQAPRPEAPSRSDCPPAPQRATEPRSGDGADPGVRSGRFRQDDAAGGVADRRCGRRPRPRRGFRSTSATMIPRCSGRT